MEQYISKSALVAEIEKRVNFNKACCAYSRADECNAILSLINNLEVKEVDLEKSISDWLFEGLPNDEELIDYIKETAEHFFELGRAASGKAQKGEEV